MSIARFDTLQNAAGSKSVPVATVVDGSAKAWVNFNGTGTVAIRAAFNVQSITDMGAGDYIINFTTAMVDANYAAVGSAESPDSTSGAGRFSLNSATAQSTTAVRVFTGTQNTSSFNVAVDNARIAVAIFR